MAKRNMQERCFPGRLTLDEWLAVPFRKRMNLIFRAQSDLLGSFRFCTDKGCRRHRTCRSEDADACCRRLSARRKVKPKTLWRKWTRIANLRWL